MYVYTTLDGLMWMKFELNWLKCDTFSINTDTDVSVVEICGCFLCINFFGLVIIHFKKILWEFEKAAKNVNQYALKEHSVGNFFSFFKYRMLDPFALLWNLYNRTKTMGQSGLLAQPNPEMGYYKV